ncbi:MAG: DNA methyltransferase [Candidatus ainarchaeum sp.]|nr:DNA methyltransferase [Candidatus ainarchaeum sp.]
MQEKLVKEYEKSAKNIALDLDNYTNNNYLTHNFHPYPAKYIPQIPKEILLRLSKKDDWILDPFCGSGTTLVEAKLCGRNSIGSDINPLSCIITKVKTTKLSENQIKEIREILNQARADFISKKKYPVPEYLNIDMWFDREIKEQLAILKYHISLVKEDEVKIF